MSDKANDRLEDGKPKANSRGFLNPWRVKDKD